MKTNLLTLLHTAVVLTALAATAGAKAAETPAPVATAAPAPTPAPLAGWENLKDFDYERRSELLSGLPDLEARVDLQVSELTAFRAALPAKTDTKDWDFSMKEMADARAYLQSVNAEIAKASRDNWDQQKDKIGQAWARTQNAYAKVKTSTTIR